MSEHYDVIITGSGAGGGTVARVRARYADGIRAAQLAQRSVMEFPRPELAYHMLVVPAVSNAARSSSAG